MTNASPRLATVPLTSFIELERLASIAMIFALLASEFFSLRETYQLFHHRIACGFVDRVSAPWTSFGGTSCGDPAPPTRFSRETSQHALQESSSPSASISCVSTDWAPPPCQSEVRRLSDRDLPGPGFTGNSITTPPQTTHESISRPGLVTWLTNKRGLKTQHGKKKTTQTSVFYFDHSLHTGFTFLMIGASLCWTASASQVYFKPFCPKKPTEFCFCLLHSNRIDCVCR